MEISEADRHGTQYNDEEQLNFNTSNALFLDDRNKTHNLSSTLCRLLPCVWFTPKERHKRKKNLINHLRPNSDVSQTSHCNMKGLSVSEVMRIESMITQVKFYLNFNSFCKNCMETQKEKLYFDTRA